MVQSALATGRLDFELSPQDSSARPWAGRESDLVVQIHRQMRTLAGPAADLDDLVQIALEQVLSARFRGTAQFSTFTHAVCYRVWMKHLRNRYRFGAVFAFLSADEAPEPIDPGTPLSELEARERLHRFYGALDRVSPKRRAVVVLHDISGEDIPTIASIVGTSEATTRSRLRDGRRRLKKLLEADPYFKRELEKEAQS